MALDPLGTDLAVLASMAADDASSADLSTRARVARPGALASLRHAFPSMPIADGTSDVIDLGTLTGRQNLAQALILRLLTPRGSLASLGHGAYGSRLSELIGKPKNAVTRALCRAYVLEVVAQEPRVEDTAVDLAFDLDRETLSSFEFTLVVQPRGNTEPVGFSLGVAL
jgi:phage baseplate assembly protein W